MHIFQKSPSNTVVVPSAPASPSPVQKNGAHQQEGGLTERAQQRMAALAKREGNPPSLLRQRLGGGASPRASLFRK